MSDEEKAKVDSVKNRIIDERDRLDNRIKKIYGEIEQLEKQNKDTSHLWKQAEELDLKIVDLNNQLKSGKINDGIRYKNGLSREGFILKLAQKNPWMSKNFVLDILMERLDEEEELLFELIEQDYSLDGEFQEDSYKDIEKNSKKGK